MTGADWAAAIGMFILNVVAALVLTIPTVAAIEWWRNRGHHKR